MSAATAAGPPAFTGLHKIAVVGVAMLAGSIPALQPLLLGALERGGTIDAGEIGQIATIEALGMTVSATLAAALFAPRRLKLLAILCIAAIVLGNFLTPLLGVDGIYAARAANGFASGLVLWILVGLMTRVANPARIFAIFVTCQGTSAFVLSGVMANFVLPRFGATGGYWMLVAIALVFGGLAAAVPDSFAQEVDAPRLAAPSPAGWLGLMAVICFMGGIFAFWVYLPAVAGALGHDFAVVSRAISTALAGQVAGGLLAIWLASRLSGQAAFIASAAGCIALIAVIVSFAELWVLYLAAGGFAALWMFAPPFQLPLLMDIDRTNRAAMFISPAQLLGVTIGPGLAALTVEANPRTPATTAVALFAAAVVLALAAHLWAGRRAAA